MDIDYKTKEELMDQLYNECGTSKSQKDFPSEDINDSYLNTPHNIGNNGYLPK